MSTIELSIADTVSSSHRLNDSLRRGPQLRELFRFCHKIDYKLSDSAFTFIRPSGTSTLWTCELSAVPVVGGRISCTGNTAANAFEATGSAAITTLNSAGLLGVEGGRLRVRLEAFGYEAPKSKLASILSGSPEKESDPDDVLSELRLLISAIQNTITSAREEAILHFTTTGSHQEDRDSLAPLTITAYKQLDNYCSQTLLPILPSFSQDSVDSALIAITIGPHADLLTRERPSLKFATFLLLLVLGSTEGNFGRLSDTLQLAVTRALELCLFVWHEELSLDAIGGTAHSNGKGSFTKSLTCVLLYIHRERWLPFISKGRIECWLARECGWFEIWSPKEENSQSEVSWDVPEISLTVLNAFEKFNALVVLPTFKVSAQPYGSAVNGFGLQSSDVDAVVILPDEWHEHGSDLHEHGELHEHGNLHEHGKLHEHGNSHEHGSESEDRPETLAVRCLAEAAEKKFPGFFKMEKVENARVPILIIKGFYDGDFVADSGTPFEINISFNHAHVLINSALLASYAKLHPKIRQVVVAVKRWAKSRGLGDSLTGGLSSYSWTLLVIAHFQYYGSLPVLSDPSITQQQLSPEAKEFFDATSVPHLLFRFFAFYHSEFDAYTLAAEVTGKGSPGAVSKKILKNAGRRLWLAISDPCEPDRVLGTSAKGFESVVSEMRRAMYLLTEKSHEIFLPGKVGRGDKWWDFPNGMTADGFEWFGKKGHWRRCLIGGRHADLFAKFRNMGLTQEGAEEKLRLFGFGKWDVNIHAGSIRFEPTPKGREPARRQYQSRPKAPVVK